MQIGHRQIECSIRTTEDMRIADTFLFSYRISGYDGLSFVQGGKSVAVGTDCHVKSMVLVFVEDHQIGAHIFLSRNCIPITEAAETRTSFSSGKQTNTQSIKTTIIIVMQGGNIHITGKDSPFFPVFTHLDGQTVTAIVQSGKEMFPNAIGKFRLVLRIPVNIESLSIGNDSGISLFIIIQDKPGHISIPCPDFHLCFVIFVFSGGQQHPSVGRSPTFGLHP